MPPLAIADHLANNAITLMVLLAFDHLVIKPFVSNVCREPRSQRAARWFFVHAFANFFVMLSSARSLLAVLANPAHSMNSTLYFDQSFFGDASCWPATFINSVHVYHMVGGFDLTAADYFHHLLFVPALGFPAQYYLGGALANWQAFYISGFPGGVDYLMLGLQKVGLLDHMTEKRVNANMNTWCRIPGILSTTVLIYVHVISGEYDEGTPFWCIVLQLILPGYNALYFGKQAVANYSVHYMLNLLGQDDLIKEHIRQRTSVTTGTDVMSWKDAIGVPQRGS